MVHDETPSIEDLGLGGQFVSLVMFAGKLVGPLPVIAEIREKFSQDLKSIAVSLRRLARES